jgi:hypothetical protein
VALVQQLEEELAAGAADDAAHTAELLAAAVEAVAPRLPRRSRLSAPEAGDGAAGGPGLTDPSQPGLASPASNVMVPGNQVC